MFRLLPETIEPDLWYVAFHRDCRYWWQRWLPGRYKHVGAFAYIDVLDVWLVYDLWPARTRLVLIPHCDMALQILGAHTIDADLMTYRRVTEQRRFPLAPFTCVSAIAHLLGIRCVAVTPHGLYRFLIKNGGALHGRTAQTAGRPASSGAA